MEKRKETSFVRTNAANQQTENIQCWVKKSQKKQQNIEDMYNSSPPQRSSCLSKIQNKLNYIVYPSKTLQPHHHIQLAKNVLRDFQYTIQSQPTLKHVYKVILEDLQMTYQSIQSKVAKVCTHNLHIKKKKRKKAC